MVLIKGMAFPLDKLNNNGEGIPSAEADNAISSLRNAVIRVCPRDSPHGCDAKDDPNAEIGHIADVWRDGDTVHTVANITDSIADRKIRDGTWKGGWSVYADAMDKQDGWVSGVKIKSLTLVNDPAWDDAKWTIAASNNATETDSINLRFYSSYELVSSVGNTMTETTIPQTGGGIPAEIQSMIDAQKAQIDELTNVKTGLETELGTLKTELGELKTVAASKDAELASRITMEEAKTIAASEITKYKEELEKGTAIERLTAAREKRGLEPKVDEYMTLTASVINKIADDLDKITISASQTPQYPANTGKASGFTVGAFKNNKWEA